MRLCSTSRHRVRRFTITSTIFPPTGNALREILTLIGCFICFVCLFFFLPPRASCCLLSRFPLFFFSPLHLQLLKCVTPPPRPPASLYHKLPKLAVLNFALSFIIETYLSTRMPSKRKKTTQKTVLQLTHKDSYDTPMVNQNRLKKGTQSATTVSVASMHIALKPPSCLKPTKKR